MARKPKKDDKAPAKKTKAKAKPKSKTEDTPVENGAQAPLPQGQEPSLRVLAQYIKDASFENPNAPDSLRADLPAPGIDLNVEVRAVPRDDSTAEVGIVVTAKAMREGQAAFICELEYSGLFAFSNIPVDQMRAVMLIECPRILFPFARQIVSDMTQSGGFPPLMLDPIDFAALYAQQNGGQSREALN